MYINSFALSATALFVGWGVLIMCASLVLFYRPWRIETKDAALRVFPAFVVGLLLIWRIKAGLHHGLEIHLLGLTAITLMFGRGLAILAVISIYVLLAFSGEIAWSAIGWNAVLVGVLPVLLAAQIQQWVYRVLPRNYFVFVFISSFLNGAIVMVFTMSLLAGFVLMTESHSIDLVHNEFVILMPLLMFPEAFLNGSLMAVLAIYRPQWVSGFDERIYMSL